MLSLLAQILSEACTVLNKASQCFVISTLSQNNESTIRFICINSQQLTLIVTFTLPHSQTLSTIQTTFSITKLKLHRARLLNQEGTNERQISLEIMHHFAGRCECCGTPGDETPLTFGEWVRQNRRFPEQRDFPTDAGLTRDLEDFTAYLAHSAPRRCYRLFREHMYTMRFRECGRFRFVPEDPDLPSFRDWQRTEDYGDFSRQYVFADYAELLRQSPPDLQRFIRIQQVMVITQRSILESESWAYETWLTAFRPPRPWS